MQWRRSACLSVAALVCSWAAQAATPAQIDAARNRGLAWLYAHQQGEGGWPSSTGARAVTTHSALEALNTAGVRGYPYFAALAFLQNIKTDSIDSVARKLHATAVAGSHGQVYSDILYLSEPYYETALWGTYAFYPENVVDTALAFRALRVAQDAGASNFPNYSVAVTNTTFCQLLRAQSTDGGWTHNDDLAYVGGDVPSFKRSALLPTVLMVLEFNAGRPTTGDSGSCYAPQYYYGADTVVRSITTATTNALNWLLTLKKADNGFGEGANSSVLETAMVYDALRTLRPADAAVGPALDYLLSKQDVSSVGVASNGGGWGGSALQTSYVLKVLPAPATALIDTDGDGVPDAVELLLGTNVAVADSRWLAGGNSSGGLPLSIVSPINALTMVSKASTLFLMATGGKPPYVWRLSSGALPPGYALNSTTGTIVGSATSTGTYNFVYAVNDSASAAAVHADGKVVVGRSTLPGDINGDGVVDAADTNLGAAISALLYLNVLQ